MRVLEATSPPARRLVEAAGPSSALLTRTPSGDRVQAVCRFPASSAFRVRDAAGRSNHQAVSIGEIRHPASDEVFPDERRLDRLWEQFVTRLHGTGYDTRKSGRRTAKKTISRGGRR